MRQHSHQVANAFAEVLIAPRVTSPEINQFTQVFAVQCGASGLMINGPSVSCERQLGVSGEQQTWTKHSLRVVKIATALVLSKFRPCQIFNTALFDGSHTVLVTLRHRQERDSASPQL